MHAYLTINKDQGYKKMMIPPMLGIATLLICQTVGFVASRCFWRFPLKEGYWIISPDFFGKASNVRINAIKASNEEHHEHSQVSENWAYVAIQRMLYNINNLLQFIDGVLLCRLPSIDNEAISIGYVRHKIIII